MPTPRGSIANISHGPGFLFYGLLGTTEPTDLTTAWPVGWVPIGYTPEGSNWSTSISVEPIEVAEELEKIGQTTVGRETKVGFAAAETTNKMLKLAMNGGTITPSGTGANAIETFEPPALGEEAFCMLGWESERHDDRFVYRQCFQTGNLETSRQKGGSNYQRYPMEFDVMKPLTGLGPWKRITKVGIVVP